MKVVNGVQIVTLEVNPDQWNTVVAGLNELPRKLSEPVLQALTLQVIQQTQPVPPPVSRPPGAELPKAA